MPKAALELGHVTVRLGGRNVVDGVSFSVERGDWVTLIGPNGAGKTSLMRAIAGLVGHRGEIRLDGDPLRALRRRDVAQRVALVPQTPLLPAGMSVEEYVLLGRTPYVSYVGREGRGDLAAAASAMARLDLAELAGRQLGTLSGGERQRAVLARALAQEAPLLLLDEPTSALDAGRQQEALELIDGLRLDAGLTVVAAMHDLTLAGLYAPKLLLLSGGRIVAEGAAAEVLTEPLIEEHYGARVRVLEGAVIPVRPVSLVVLLGGARSGKSALAQRLAGEEATLIATAAALDSEMEERIRRHRAERPSGWTTVEETIELGAALADVGPQSSVVVDCLSLWVANLLEAGWADGEVEATAGSVAGAAAGRAGLTVAVSNEVGMGIVPVTPLGRRYRDVLGRVNASWVEAADRALLVVAGKAIPLVDA